MEDYCENNFIFDLPVIRLWPLSIGRVGVRSNSAATPPSYCHPCLFYGGDFDESNPSANALSNLLVGSRQFSAVYVPFVVPKAQVWTVPGFFSNNMSNTASLDPPLIKWSISSGVSAGHAGTAIAQGTAHATYTPTGRTWSGLSEYTTLGHLTPQTVGNSCRWCVLDDRCSHVHRPQ